MLSPGRYEKSIRVWRDTDETNNEYKADMTVPLSRTLRFKTGANYQMKDRSHRERKFIYAITDRYKSYSGDLNAFFGDVGMRNGTYSRSYEFNGVTNRSIDVHVVGLRRKLGDAGSYIETVKGAGYRFRE